MKSEEKLPEKILILSVLSKIRVTMSRDVNCSLTCY